MKRFFNSIVIVLIGLVNINCKQRSFDDKTLCKDFIHLNKDADFSSLYDLYIGDRFKSVYVDSENKYYLTFNSIYIYDNDRHEYVNVFVFSKNASSLEKETAFNRCSSIAKDFLLRKFRLTKNDELFDKYVSYISTILQSYYKIKTPSYYNNVNVPLEGNPMLGDFITFKLSATCKCYYVKNKSLLTPYWRKFFNNAPRLNDHWYYELKPY